MSLHSPQVRTSICGSSGRVMTAASILRAQQKASTLAKPCVSAPSSPKPPKKTLVKKVSSKPSTANTVSATPPTSRTSSSASSIKTPEFLQREIDEQRQKNRALEEENLKMQILEKELKASRLREIAQLEKIVELETKLKMAESYMTHKKSYSETASSISSAGDLTTPVSAALDRTLPTLITTTGSSGWNDKQQRMVLMDPTKDSLSLRAETMFFDCTAKAHTPSLSSPLPSSQIPTDNGLYPLSPSIDIRRTKKNSDQSVRSCSFGSSISIPTSQALSAVNSAVNTALEEEDDDELGMGELDYELPRSLPKIELNLEDFIYKCTMDKSEIINDAITKDYILKRYQNLKMLPVEIRRAEEKREDLLLRIEDEKIQLHALKREANDWHKKLKDTNDKASDLRNELMTALEKFEDMQMLEQKRFANREENASDQGARNMYGRKLNLLKQRVERCQEKVLEVGLKQSKLERQSKRLDEEIEKKQQGLAIKEHKFKQGILFLQLLLKRPEDLELTTRVQLYNDLFRVFQESQCRFDSIETCNQEKLIGSKAVLMEFQESVIITMLQELSKLTSSSSTLPTVAAVAAVAAVAVKHG